ncbi:MAG TPA: BatA and WFA domain-containing protein [Pseudomonadales bacterium]
MLLTPLFLAGLLGLALPWWLHRLETQTTEREKFATTRFLEASKKRIHVQRKLKFLLLMALRMLFLALLAFAFARPILLEDPEAAVTGDTTHHVIVVDTSFSMNQGDKFATARERVNAIASGMGDDDIASLYAASSGVREIVEPGSSGEDVTQAIAALEPDNGRLDLGTMISALNGMIEASSANFVLHVVSDFQQTSQAVRFADMIPDVINGRPVTLDIQQVAPAPVANFTIDSVIVENRATVIASVRAFNIESPGEKQLTLSVNGVEQQQQSVNIPANGAYLVEFDDVTFGEGDNRVDITLSPADALPQDDMRYTVFDNSPPAPVLLLTADTSSLGVTYMRAALETAPRGYSVEVTDIADFDPRVMQRYPWLIIEDVGTLNSTLEAALLDYINGGGSVLAASGPRSGQLTAMPLMKTNISSAVADPRAAPPQIVRIDTTHPVLNNSAGWANVNARTLRVQTTADDQILVAQAPNTPVLIERAIGAGRLLLLTTSIDNSASDLPVKPVFVSFVAKAAQYLSNEKLLVKEQVADSFLQLAQTGGASGQVVDPDGVNLLSLQDTTIAQDVQLNKRGYYQVFTPGGEVLVAVNPDIRESDPAPMPPAALQNWQNVVAGAAPVEATATSTSAVASDESEFEEVEIWRFFLILLGLMVLAETLLGNRYLNIKTGSF